MVEADAPLAETLTEYVPQTEPISTTNDGKLSLYRKLQRQFDIQLQGIRWRMDNNIRMKAAGGEMYYINTSGTLKRHTPRKGKKTKRTCSVERWN